MAKKGSNVDTVCYAIEKILESRTNADAQLEYLIKWKDSELQPTWVSVDNLFATKMTQMQALSNENSSQVSWIRSNTHTQKKKNHVGF